MAGINRLGKAPPRPGSLRPPDPNKYRTMDMYSEGGENDADYMRMVQDIEDTQQNHVGWLFGRGAFDKGDLLYLRDEEEKRRFLERDQREKERSNFLIMRARENAERTASLAESQKNMKDKLPSRPKLVPTITKVQPGKAAQQDTPPRQNADNDSAGPAAKRQKPSPAAASEPAADQAIAQGSTPPVASPVPAAEGALAGLLGGYDSDGSSAEGGSTD